MGSSDAGSAPVRSIFDRTSTSVGVKLAHNKGGAANGALDVCHFLDAAFHDHGHALAYVLAGVVIKFVARLVGEGEVHSLAAVLVGLVAEKSLPTLQNLESEASQKSARGYPRYDPSFLGNLTPYEAPNSQPYGAAVNGYSARFQSAVKAAAIEHEWNSYYAQAGSAGDTLTGLVTGALLLGLLAGAAAGGGTGAQHHDGDAAKRSIGRGKAARDIEDRLAAGTAHIGTVDHERRAGRGILEIGAVADRAPRRGRACIARRLCFAARDQRPTV